MADTTALKNRIRAAVKSNDNQEITGHVLQQALLDIVDELNGATETEADARQSGDSTLQQAINTERQARIDADNALGQRITDEEQARIDADNALGQRITDEEQAREEAFNDLDLIDAAGSEVSPNAIDLTLRKNDGSEEDPEWRTLCHLLIPSVSAERAGLMSVAMRNLLYNLRNAGYAFGGIAVPNTNPNPVIANCFYIVRGAGTYTYFKNADNESIVIENDGLYVLTYEAVENNYWEHNLIVGIDSVPTAESESLVKSRGVHAELKKIYDVFDSSEDTTLYVTDANGNIVAKIDENGLTDVNTEKTRNDILQALSLGEILRDEQDGFYITDKDGNVAFTISTTGEVNYNGKNNSSDTLKDNGNTPSDVVLNLMYGQSLSEGGFVNSGQYMSTLLQFDSVDDYKMLSCDETIMASETLLANYFGSDFLPSKTGITCTPIGFANLMFMQLLKNENGIDIDFKEGDEPNYYFQLLGVNPTRSTGPNWVTIADPESLYYRRLLKAVEYGKKIAEANNKTFSVGSLCYMQGEHGSDSTHSADTRKEFHDKLWVLFSNLNHDIKAITGQDYDVLFLTYQLASQAASQYMDGYLDIPLAQLDIAMETGGGEGYTLSSYPAQYLQDGVELIDRKYIQLGAIMNSLDYANESDKIHATNNSYITAGAEFGIKLKRYIYDEAKLNIIYPISHKIIQRTSDWLVVLDMNVPVAPLVFDTEHLECQSARANSANYGFSILNGATELITDVYLRRGKEVLLACSANPIGLSLTYAKDGWIVGGNLRDSQNIPFTVNGFNNVIHNWCPTFEITL